MGFIRLLTRREPNRRPARDSSSRSEWRQPGHRYARGFPLPGKERARRVSSPLSRSRIRPHATRIWRPRNKAGSRRGIIGNAGFSKPEGPRCDRAAHGGKARPRMYLIGYCPRYLRADILQLLQWGLSPRITVERVNPPPAPVQVRVLCKLVMQWPEGFSPYSTDDYAPLAAMGVAASRISLPPRHVPYPAIS